MYQPLPSFPPLFPPDIWWKIFIVGRIEGAGTEKAILQANRESGIKAREWMRIRIAEECTLSMPLAGGASTLKNHPPQSWRFSRESEREGRKMVETIATLYGRTPFFPFIKDDLENILSGFSEGKPVEGMCQDGFRMVEKLLSLSDTVLLESLKLRMAQGDPLLKSLKNQYSPSVESCLSILVALFSVGQDAIFGLLPAF